MPSFYGQWIRKYVKPMGSGENVNTLAHVWETRSNRLFVDFNRGYHDRSFTSYSAMLEWLTHEGFVELDRRA